MFAEIVYRLFVRGKPTGAPPSKVGTIQGFWLHVDVDVIDSTLMPAVDSPENCGLSWAEFDAPLGAFLRDPKLVGLNVGIFDPELDPSGEHAWRIATVLRRRLI